MWEKVSLWRESSNYHSFLPLHLMSTSAPSPFVIAIVTTYRRTALLRNLLKSLKTVCTRLVVLVVDNGGDTETEKVVQDATNFLEITRLVPGSNLGCGGGLQYGERVALERYPAATHFWIMDDDTEVAPEALERMLTAMAEQNAIAACPTILDQLGRMNWFPGLLNSKAFSIIKKRCLPPQYLARCGDTPVPFSWATGVSLLVKREAFERLGLHREDFWIRGEDIEFSLRLTHKNQGVFVPSAVVFHACPIFQNTPEALETERKKELSMLRNHAYIIHLPHGRRIFKNLPGSLWRFVRTFGISNLGIALHALWQGGIKQRSAGVDPKIF